MIRALALLLLLAVAGSAQAAITFVAVGTAAHADNTTATPGLPSGHTSDDTLLIIDGVHSTAASPAASGYTTLKQDTGLSSGKLTAFGKNDGGSESAPNVTVSGGASGDLHSAVMIALRGAQTDMAQILSASANLKDSSVDQSLQYPALTITDANTAVVLAVRWNKDAAATCTLSTPSGFTKVGQYASSTANDQTLAVYYQIQTTATNIPSGAVTVSGCSTTGPSQALVLALRVAGTITPPPVTATCTLVSTGTKATGTGTLTPGAPAGYSPGDLLLFIGGARAASETASSITGYTQVAVHSSGNPVIWGRIATGSDGTPSTDFSGSTTGVAYIAAYHSTTGWPAIGSLLVNSATGSATLTATRYRSLTVTQDNTCALQMALKQTTTGNTNIPTVVAVTGGYTAAGQFAGVTTASGVWISSQFQSQSTATNLAQSDETITGNSDSAIANGVSITMAMGATIVYPLISSVDSDNDITYVQTGFTIAGTDFKSSQGAGFAQIVDSAITCALTINTWADTSINADMPGTCHSRLGSRVLRVQNSDGNAYDKPITLSPTSDGWYSDISGIVALDFNTLGTAAGRIKGQPNRYYDSPTDLADGDQLNCKRTAGSGTLTLNADATFTAPSTLTQMQCRFWDDTSDTWGTFQSWDLTGVPPTFSGPSP